MARKHWSDFLVKWSACEGGLAFARQFKTMKAAWEACPVSDWMLWLVGRFNLNNPCMILNRIKLDHTEEDCQGVDNIRKLFYVRGNTVFLRKEYRRGN